MLRRLVGSTWRQSSRLLSCRSYHLFQHSEYKPFQQLQQHAPSLSMNGQAIQPLYQPAEFYHELKQRILTAKDRVFIAALYIGQSEKELIDTIHTALLQSSKLQVHIVIDGLRGTRITKDASSLTLLAPLVQQFPDRFRVSMYHTPDLNGVLKQAIPPRFNESIGLMHLKVYGFDDAVMLSGANLSTDYFTNRQDRYMLFHDGRLSDYYAQLLETVGSFSYQLTTRSQLTMADNMVDPVKQSRLFKKQARQKLQAFLQEQQDHFANYSNLSRENKHHDTVLFPVIQMGPFGIRQDEQMTLGLLNVAHQQGNLGSPWTIDLTSGYFNFTNQYKRVILNTNAQFHFLTASPEANGFYRSRGVSRFLPPAYTYIERQFYDQVNRSGKQDSIRIEEYNRPGWTYHAKGLWAYLRDQSLPSLTMIGSPNFGHRSSHRDLEAQSVIVTSNTSLQEALHKEVEQLHEYSTIVSKETFAQPDRRVPHGVKIAAKLVKTML
ncbi:hypothetical protein DM01DRAFT_1335850 [Hesseltinella vesiculosa]|uniref:CDP-diacylglycerol--glycerol-3-phosphate 3-phosphatidyltransferase n=1 Tax=Hesseltinella vesiculosa TaxID=101127 RepID=A0A1X2GIQ4_9FUNG|nr:hypothetical protein DM01DRAFT_1335850 [Hesseltinella vesiculosa]